VVPAHPVRCKSMTHTTALRKTNISRSTR